MKISFKVACGECQKNNWEAIAFSVPSRFEANTDPLVLMIDGTGRCPCCNRILDGRDAYPGSGIVDGKKVSDEELFDAMDTWGTIAQARGGLSRTVTFRF